MKIQEADAKSLLVAQSLPVPPWEVAHTAAEARAAAERFFAEGAQQVVIKAQVLVGGRPRWVAFLPHPNARTTRTFAANLGEETLGRMQRAVAEVM